MTTDHWEQRQNSPPKYRVSNKVVYSNCGTMDSRRYIICRYASRSCWVRWVWENEYVACTRDKLVRECPLESLSPIEEERPAVVRALSHWRGGSISKHVQARGKSRLGHGSRQNSKLWITVLARPTPILQSDRTAQISGQAVSQA
jgi:hypothetical protein